MISIKDYISFVELFDIVESSNNRKYLDKILCYVKALILDGQLLSPNDTFFEHRVEHSVGFSSLFDKNFYDCDVKWSFLSDLLVTAIFGNSKEPEICESLYNNFDKTSWKEKTFELEVHETCRCCGSFIKISYSYGNWLIFASEVRSEYGNFKTIPVTHCFRAETEKFMINFPTGELLIFDWFWDDFFDILNSGDYGDFDTDKGKTMLADEASNLGFVRVFVGNTSPHIIKHNSHKLIALKNDNQDYYDEILNKYENIQCLTDMHNVIIIDKKNLEKLVVMLKESVLDCDISVESLVDKLSKNKITVEPGHYFLTYKAGKNLDNKDVGIEYNVNSYFSLEKEN